MAINPFVKERRENMKRVVSIVAETGELNKKYLVGKVSLETGLSATRIEEYINTLVDARVLVIKEDRVFFIEQDKVKPPQ